MTGIRVAYLIDSLGAGGSERSLAELVPHLIDAGIEPRVFVLKESELGFSRLLEARGVEITLLEPASWPRRIALLRRRLEAWRARLLHTTLFYSDVIGRLAAAGTSIPVLSSLVNSSYEPERLADPAIRRWRLKAVQTIDGWTGRHLTTHFHAVSRAVADSAIARLRLAASRITIVERGRDLERLGEPSARRRLEARRRWQVADDRILVVNVGRQAFQKAQLVLLEAVRRLVDGGAPVELLIAGGRGSCSGELDSYLRAHDLGGRARLVGHVDDVAELLSAADVFAFPSRFEGCPGAVLEAMAMALPVVASDIPPLREIFAGREGALLVPRDAPSELAGALETLAADAALRQALGRGNRETFVERFDIRRTAPAMIELYERVVASGRASREAA